MVRLRNDIGRRGKDGWQWPSSARQLSTGIWTVRLRAGDTSTTKTEINWMRKAESANRNVLFR
jgi:hypothetical protein